MEYVIAVLFLRFYAEYELEVIEETTLPFSFWDSHEYVVASRFRNLELPFSFWDSESWQGPGSGLGRTSNNIAVLFLRFISKIFLFDVVDNYRLIAVLFLRFGYEDFLGSGHEKLLPFSFWDSMKTMKNGLAYINCRSLFEIQSLVSCIRLPKVVVSIAVLFLRFAG